MMTEIDRHSELHRLLAGERDALDREIARSGALVRIRGNVLRRATADPLAGLHWRRIAAAVLIAGMLGCAVDLLLPARAPDPVDVAIVDTPYEFDLSAAR